MDAAYERFGTTQVQICWADTSLSPSGEQLKNGQNSGYKSQCKPNTGFALSLLSWTEALWSHIAPKFL